MTMTFLFFSKLYYYVTSITPEQIHSLVCHSVHSGRLVGTPPLPQITGRTRLYKAADKTQQQLCLSKTAAAYHGWPVWSNYS